jgi:hypothetical protein
MERVTMATLRTPVKYLDCLMDKISKEMFTVLHEELHSVWVIKDGGGAAPFEMPKHKINLAFTKVDPKVVRVLYGNEEVDNNTDKPTDNADGTSAG